MSNLPKIFTPYLRQLGSNAYTVVFKSADLQLGYMSSNSGISGRRAKFSKYALLDLPDIVRPVNGQNTIQLDAIEGAYAAGLSTTPGSAGDNIDFVQSLQNYALNLEAMLLENPDYDMSTHQTVAERVMFKWLKEIGALRWKPNTADKASTVTDSRFDEHDDNADPDSGDLYDKVVRMLGEIDVQGDLHSNYGSKQQIYFYIPSQVGSTPKVLFKSVVDDNYFPSQLIRQTDAQDREFIQGSDIDDQPNPAGLSVSAFYDLDVPKPGFLYTVNILDTVYSWFDAVYDPSIVNSYLTDLVAEDTTVDIITRENTDNTDNIEFRRSRLDCVQLDFDKGNYLAFENDAELKSLMDYNTASGARSFSFNAIAIYYDVIENDQILATNLYGIMFIGDLAPTSGAGSTFKALYKQKPDSVLGVSGNGYGLILNINRDGNNNNQNTIVNVSINDYNTYSMQLFTKAMLQLGLLTEKYEQTLTMLNTGYDKMRQLEDLLINDENKVDILEQIQAIRTLLVGSTTNANLVALVSKMSDQMNAMLAGRTTVSIDVLYNLIGQDGLQIDKDTANNMLVFKDNKETYSYNQIFDLDIDSIQDVEAINAIPLKQKCGLVIHRSGGVAKDLYQHVSLRIAEAEFTWKTNQSVQFYFDDIINFNSKTIKVYTGINGAYEVIGTVVAGRTFTVVCIDAIRRDFIIIN